MWPSTNRAELTAVCESLGLEPITPNELRHTFATLASERGVPTQVIADMMGHKSTRMVETRTWTYPRRPTRRESQFTRQSWPSVIPRHSAVAFLSPLLNPHRHWNLKRDLAGASSTSRPQSGQIKTGPLPTALPRVSRVQRDTS